MMRPNSKAQYLLTKLRDGGEYTTEELANHLDTSKGALRVFVCQLNKFLHGERIERVGNRYRLAVVDTVLAG